MSTVTTSCASLPALLQISNGTQTRTRESAELLVPSGILRASAHACHTNPHCQNGTKVGAGCKQLRLTTTLQHPFHRSRHCLSYTDLVTVCRHCLWSDAASGRRQIIRIHAVRLWMAQYRSVGVLAKYLRHAPPRRT
jgi:hypothetical protein